MTFANRTPKRRRHVSNNLASEPKPKDYRLASHFDRWQVKRASKAFGTTGFRHWVATPIRPAGERLKVHALPREPQLQFQDRDVALTYVGLRYAGEPHTIAKKVAELPQPERAALIAAYRENGGNW